MAGIIGRAMERQRCQQKYSRCNVKTVPRRTGEVEWQQRIEDDGHDTIHGRERRPKASATEPEPKAASGEYNPARVDVKIVWVPRSGIEGEASSDTASDDEGHANLSG